jgi:predicted nucleic acid-binding protein
MVKALFDTNILIDYLRGIPAAREELTCYRQKAISLVSWTEVPIGQIPRPSAARIRVDSHRPRDRPASGGATQDTSRQAAGRNRVGIRAGVRDVACYARCQEIP